MDACKSATRTRPQGGTENRAGFVRLLFWLLNSFSAIYEITRNSELFGVLSCTVVNVFVVLLLSSWLR